jgi:hypothetical protein
MRKRVKDLKPTDIVIVGQTDLSNEAEVAGNLDVRHLANGPGLEPDGALYPPTEVFWRGDGTWRRPPGTPGGPSVSGIPDTSLAIHAGPLLMGIKRQPATVVFPYPSSRPWFDATGYRWVRLIVDVAEAGFDTSQLFVEYTATPEDDDSWATPSAIGAPVTVDLSEVGPHKTGGRFLLAPEAQADVVWRVPGLGGNDEATPFFAEVHIQFHPGEEGDDTTPVMEPMYWRGVAPSVSPSDIPGVNGFKGSGGCVPLHSWVAPTPEDVAGGPGSLLHATGFTSGNLVGTTVDEQADYNGPMGRFISPPLAAQPIPSFVSESACVARNQSAEPDAGYVWIRLSLWRPSTDQWVARSTFQAENDPWFRYVEKGRVLHVFFPRVVALAGDRWVLDVSANLANGCAVLSSTQGAATIVMFDGPYTAIIDGADMSGILPASYTKIPVLTYLSEVA